MEAENIEHGIKENINVIFSFFSYKEKDIKIHINSDKTKDYARMLFVLFTLSRAYKNNFLTEGQSKILLSMFPSIYQEAKNNVDKDYFRYIDLYGMRFCLNMGESYTSLIDSFRIGHHAYIFSYPVITYLFVSTYIECNELKKVFPFSESLFNQAMNCLDFITLSNLKERYHPFHYSEFSSWGLDSRYLFIKASYELTYQKFKAGYPYAYSTSSGVAKCMEDFARRGERELFMISKQFLDKRKLSKYDEYINPNQKHFADSLYTEDGASQYICLDTNAHLLNAYLNLYERK